MERPDSRLRLEMSTRCQKRHYYYWRTRELHAKISARAFEYAKEFAIENVVPRYESYYAEVVQSFQAASV